MLLEEHQNVGGPQWRMTGTPDAPSWSCFEKERPVGLTRVRVHSSPGGRYLDVEGNPAAALYGEAGAFGSLESADEVREGIAQVLKLAEEWAGLESLRLRPGGLSLTRVDPSVTLRIADPSSVIGRATSAWRLRVGTDKRQRLQRIYGVGGGSATLVMGKARSWTAYDKAAEGAARGFHVPNSVRVEGRIRPKKLAGPRWSVRGTLALEEEVLRAVDEETTEMLDSFLTHAAGSALSGLVKVFMRGGASASTAYRLAAVYMEAEALGWGEVDIVAAKSTGRRWRAEVKKYLNAAGVDGVDEVLQFEMDRFTSAQAAQEVRHTQLRDESDQSV